MTPPGQVHRILLTADTLGGVWTHALSLCRGLADHGVEVLLATMGPRPSDAQRTAAAECRNVVLRESEFRLEWMESPWRDVDQAGRWLLQLAAAFRPDVVHLNGYAHAALSWRMPVLVGAHSCVLSWWRAVRGEEAPHQWIEYTERAWRGLAAADVVVAPSRAMLAALHEHYGFPARSQVIPNGCTPGAFRPARKEPLVLCVGRLWDEAKNVRSVAEAAPALAWPVCMAGDAAAPGGERCEFPHVTWLGRCEPEDLARHYGRASIYVLPARYEPFGLSVLEAALSGCALVLGDIASLRENWDGAAVFVPPGCKVRLAAAINALIERPAWRQELARLAAERARTFTAGRMTAAYLQAYQELRDNASSPADAVALPA